MALINFTQLADMVDFDSVVTKNIWQAEDDVTGAITVATFEPGTLQATVESEMQGGDDANNPAVEPITSLQPLWRYDTVTKTYEAFGDDGLKLLRLDRDPDGNAILTMFDNAGVAVVPGWIDLTRQPSNQTGIVSGTDLILSKVAGTLAHNDSTGVTTLKAGKLYRLSATFAFFSLEVSDTVAVEWVKDSDNTPVSGSVHETRMRPANAASNGTNASVIETLYQPSSDEGVKLHCTEYTHSTDSVIMYSNRSMATIVELR